MLFISPGISRLLPYIVHNITVAYFHLTILQNLLIVFFISNKEKRNILCKISQINLILADLREINCITTYTT